MTTMENVSRDLPPAARAEAAAWIARLHGPGRSTALEAGFRRWLEADPRHARAFEGMTEIWDAVAGASAGRFPRVNPPLQRPGRRKKSLAIAATILAVCGIAGFAARGLLRDPVYVTTAGDRRTVDLDDGSRVTLNSNTRMVVTHRDAVRRVGLERGEAIFDVAADRRPFVVTAGDYEITALGTVFIVRHDPSRTAVTLVEGRIRVASPDDAFQPPVLLRPGERITIAAHHTEQLDKPSAGAIAAWRRGEVLFDHTPLADAAAEMNRYHEKIVVIDDPAVAALRISGNYKAGDARGFARAVATMYGLEIADDRDRIRVWKPSR